MDAVAAWLFGPNNLTPHGLCLIWRPDLIWAFVIADSVIAAAYFSIPVCLATIVRRRGDIPFSRILVLSTGFILLCGMTHVMDAVTLWVPAYGLEAALEAATAVFSLATAIALWKLLPGLLALPSAEQYRQTNNELVEKVAETQRAQQQLRELSTQLELRVQERTASLTQTTRQLALEISQRRTMEDNFRQVVEAAPNAMIMIDQHGCIELVNKKTGDLFGYPHPELLGSCIDSLLPPDLMARHGPLRLAYFADPQPREMGLGRDLFARRKDGSSFPVEIGLNPIMLPDGVRVICSIVDISHRKDIERQLVESNERYAIATGAAGLGFWSYNVGKSTVFWDEQMYRLYGCSASDDEQPYALWTSHLHPEDRAHQERLVQHVIETGIRYDTEFRIIRPDGRIRYLKAYGAARKAADGQTLFVGVNFDVSMQRLAEAELERARDAAEAANRAKSEFLAVMSHEVRTPMNGIMGMNALLLSTELTARQRKMAETVRYSADTLMATLDDVLDISKLEAGKIHLDEVEFSLLSLIEKAVDLIRSKADEKGLSLNTDISRVRRDGLSGDPLRLRQIALNLGTNAIKFTDLGAITLVVATEDLDRQRSRLRIEVHDTGCGVSEEAKQRLFKPFEQADRSITRRYGGTGLGLSICKKLVDLMEGEIGLIDRLGGGSIFWFEVILKNARPAETMPATIDPMEIAPRAANREGHILLVEDNLINVEVATMILEDKGYAVDVAHDGLQALEAIRQRPYHLILMDMQMPNMDGLAATQQIRLFEREDQHVPIVAMTGNAMAEDRARCIAAGMDDFIAKPFAQATLLNTVARWLDAGRGQPDTATLDARRRGRRAPPS